MATPPGIKEVFRAGRLVGYRVFQWVQWPGYPDGRVRSKRFPKTTTPSAMQQWQEDRRVESRSRMTAGAAAAPVTAVGFLADADEYLEARQSMPGIQERTRHMRLWADVFGDVPTLSIEAFPIRAQAERWVTVGPKWVYEKGKRVLKPLPLSGQEVNLRLRALQNFFTVKYPKHDNPVRLVPEYAGAVMKPRGQSFALVQEILRHWPDVTTPKKGELAEDGSLSRIRFEVELYTGLEHKQLARLQRSDITWDPVHPSYLPPRRLKGTSPGKRERPRKEPKRQPLMPFVLPKLTQFFELGANKPFSRHSIWRSLHAAIRAANRERARLGIEDRIDEHLTLKDLTRHTFATETLRQSGKLHVVKELIGHSTLAQTEVYTQAALNEDAIAAVGALHALVSPRQGGKVGGKVSPPSEAVSDRSVRLVKRRKVQSFGAPGQI